MKTLAKLTLLLLLALAFYSCVTGDNDTKDTTPENSLGSVEMSLLNHNATAKTFSYIESDYICKDTVAVLKKDTLAMYYEIIDSILWVTNLKSCEVTKYMGNSPTLQGTWLLDLDTLHRLPSGYTPPGCASFSLEDQSEWNIYESFKQSLEITKNSVEVNLSGKLCPTKGLTSEIPSADFLETLGEVKIINCNNATITSPVGKTANVSVTENTNTIDISFKTGGQTCNLPLPNTIQSSLNEAPQCNELQFNEIITTSLYQNFIECMVKSGFLVDNFNPFPLFD